MWILLINYDISKHLHVTIGDICSISQKYYLWFYPQIAANQEVKWNDGTKIGKENKKRHDQMGMSN